MKQLIALSLLAFGFQSFASSNPTRFDGHYKRTSANTSVPQEYLENSCPSDLYIITTNLNNRWSTYLSPKSASEHGYATTYLGGESNILSHTNRKVTLCRGGMSYPGEHFYKCSLRQRIFSSHTTHITISDENRLSHVVKYSSGEMEATAIVRTADGIDLRFSRNKANERNWDNCTYAQVAN